MGIDVPWWGWVIAGVLGGGMFMFIGLTVYLAKSFSQ
jgi:hypothetical protein